MTEQQVETLYTGAPSHAEREPASPKSVATAPAVALSIVIPAKDEALRLPRTLRLIGDWCERNAIAAEVIVVDDGSVDDTARLAANSIEMFSRVLVLRQGTCRGKGAAVRRGVLAAGAPHVLVTDADLSTPIEEYSRLASTLALGSDIAAGSRTLPESRILERQSWRRRLAGWVFRLLAAHLVRTGVRDTQCGFKLMRREVAWDLARRSSIDGFAFDVEWLALANRARFRVAEVPVQWGDDRRSTLRLGNASREMLADLLRLAWRFRGAPRRRR